MSTTSAGSVDPSRCPLCTQPNACGIAAGASTCWCFDTTVPASVLSRVPAEAQGVACICRGCALPPDPSPTVSAEAASASADPEEDRRRLAALRWLKR